MEANWKKEVQFARDSELFQITAIINSKRIRTKINFRGKVKIRKIYTKYIKIQNSLNQHNKTISNISKINIFMHY